MAPAVGWSNSMRVPSSAWATTRPVRLMVEEGWVSVKGSPALSGRAGTSNAPPVETLATSQSKVLPPAATWASSVTV